MDKFVQSSLFEVNLQDMTKNSSTNHDRTSKITHLSPNLATSNLPPFKVIKDSKRKKNILAIRNQGLIEIHVPTRLTRAEIEKIVPEMIGKVLDQEIREAKGDDYLAREAKKIIKTLLPEINAVLELLDANGMPTPLQISWRTMNERWGSCTWKENRIRISHRLTLAPDYVVSSVIFHELAHLLVHDHGPEFQKLLARDPNLVAAESFLDGYEYGITHGNFFRPEMEKSSSNNLPLNPGSLINDFNCEIPNAG